jgi:hypothetical protein
MIADQQNYINRMANKYGVSPHQLMDTLNITFSGGNYHVNNRTLSTYFEAIQEAESQKMRSRSHAESKESLEEQSTKKNKNGFKVINNIHFLMCVIYAHISFALMIFLLSLGPYAPMKLVIIQILVSMLLALHYSAFIMWRNANRVAKSLSIISGLILLPNFPLGSIFGVMLIYYAFELSQTSKESTAGLEV